MAALNKVFNNLIYTLSDPFTHEVRYVGYSTQGLKRPKAHLVPSNWKHNSYKSNWIKSVVSLGKLPYISVISQWEVISFEELENAEKYWISYFRDNGSPLTNLTDGGGGMFGYKRSSETLLKLSIASRGNKNNLGRKRSLETKEKIALSLTGRKQSPETIKKAADSRRGKKKGPMPQHVKDKISSTKMGKKHTPEIVAKISAANKGRKHTPESILNMSLAKMGNKNGCMAGKPPRKTASDVGKSRRPNYRPTEETKLKISESLKNSWAKRKDR